MFERRITKINSLTIDINIPDNNFDHTQTESKAVGSLIYISEQIFYELCNDLDICCSEQLESVFIVLVPNKQNQITEIHTIRHTVTIQQKWSQDPLYVTSRLKQILHFIICLTFLKLKKKTPTHPWHIHPCL